MFVFFDKESKSYLRFLKGLGFSWSIRGVINGKEGKTAALPKILDVLILYPSRGGGQIMPNHWLSLT